ncbi:MULTISPECIES: hypothetical protein [unclassified Streptomyces]|uniref:hypothetical protein n=1 Tax=unclassified Streptomyces TaxID=2593676 RepID=UPI00226E1F35|nr:MULTISPECIES: hypothetical protein [unclassified Streptomyces]MCY0921875.1 hypothetical protein [Streptomyces sp. H27-G5]MCY0957176.1 hypothetical protein [Streptomyces sp. H27-H5]
MTAPFSRAAARNRLGPTAVEAIRDLVAAAPPLTAEQRQQIQAVFESARPTAPVSPALQTAA